MEDLDLAVLVPDNDELPPVGSFLVALATLLVTLAVVWWIIRYSRNQNHHKKNAKTKGASSCQEDLSSTIPESDLDSSLEEGKHRAGAASSKDSEDIRFDALEQSIAHSSSSEEFDDSFSFYGSIAKWIANRFQKNGKKPRLDSESVHVRIAMLLAEQEAWFQRGDEFDRIEFERIFGPFADEDSLKSTRWRNITVDELGDWQSARYDDFSDIDPYLAPGPSREAADMPIPSMLLPKPSSIVIPTRVLTQTRFPKPILKTSHIRIPTNVSPAIADYFTPSRSVPWNESPPRAKQVQFPKVATVMTKTTNHAPKPDVDDVLSLSRRAAETVSTKNVDPAPDPSNDLCDIEIGVDGSWSIHNLALSQYRSDLDAATIPFLFPAPRQRTVSLSRCNCKKSRCLKLYCECLAAEHFCQGCNCINCCNTPENHEEREKAIKEIRSKNSKAFQNRFSVENRQKAQNTGCKCKKSACLKKYCECFDGGALCGAKCKCSNCSNVAGSQALIDERRRIKDRSGAEYDLQASKSFGVSDDDSSSSESDGVICDDEIFSDAIQHMVESSTPPGFNYTLSLSGKGDINDIDQSEKSLTAEELFLQHRGADESSFKSCSSEEFDDSFSFYDSDQEKEKEQAEQIKDGLKSSLKEMAIGVVKRIRKKSLSATLG